MLLFLLSQIPKNSAGIRDCCHFCYLKGLNGAGVRYRCILALSNSWKNAGVRHCCNFCYFWCLKKCGNIMLLPFFAISDAKKTREYDTVAISVVSGAWKQAKLQYCCNFCYFRYLKRRRSTILCPLNPSQMLDTRRSTRLLPMLPSFAISNA